MNSILSIIFVKKKKQNKTKKDPNKIHNTHTQNTTQANLKIKTVKNLNYEYTFDFFFFVCFRRRFRRLLFFCFVHEFRVSRKYHNNQRQYLKFELVWQHFEKILWTYFIVKNINIPKNYQT